MDQPTAPLLHARARAAQARSDLVATIERNIAAGVWKPGDKLSTERELQQKFGVARNTLRKALDRLEEAGLIVRHVGRGSFVAEPVGSQSVSYAQNLVDRVVGSSPTEVMEVRLVLEPWAASLCATRATAADLAYMRECNLNAEAANTVGDFEVWDGKLHQSMIASAKNGLLAGLYEAIDLARHQPEWMKLKERTVDAARRALYQQQHRAIVEALSERNAKQASELVQNHLLAVRMALVGF